MKNAMVQLAIDKRSGVSIHRQMVNQICALIDCGRLKGGDRLPTERMLSEKYGVARGTVKAAYQELMRIGKVYAVQGSGTYIRDVRPNIAQGNIRTLLANTLAIALNAGLSFDCVEDLLRQEYRRMLCGSDAVRICWVGVTREVLVIGALFLKNIEHVQLTSYMESQIEEDPSLMENADLIVTTENPYEQLLKLSETGSDKILSLSVTLDEECIVNIARRCVGKRVLMCDMDALFMEWVHEIEGMLDPAESVVLARSNEPRLMEIAAQCDLLLLPPPDTFRDNPELVALERWFRGEGREVLYVFFHFDRGSMIHLQSRILSIWSRRDELRSLDTVQRRKGGNQ